MSMGVTVALAAGGLTVLATPSGATTGPVVTVPHTGIQLTGSCPTSVSDPIVETHVGTSRFPTITQTEACGIEDLENDAYESFLTTHGGIKPQTTTEGPSEYAGVIWTFLERSLNAVDVPSTTSTPTTKAPLPGEQEAAAWFLAIVQPYLELAADDAQAEYKKWEKNPCDYVSPYPTLFTYTSNGDVYCTGTLTAPAPTPPSLAELEEFGMAEAAAKLGLPLLGDSVDKQLVNLQQAETEAMDGSADVWSSLLTGPAATIVEKSVPGLETKLNNLIFPNRRAGNAVRMRNVDTTEEKVNQTIEEDLDGEPPPTEATSTEVTASETAGETALDAGEDGGFDVLGALSDLAGDAAGFIGGAAAALATGPAAAFLILGIVIGVVISVGVDVAENSPAQTTQQLAATLEKDVTTAKGSDLWSTIIKSTGSGGSELQQLFQSQLTETIKPLGIPVKSVDTTTTPPNVQTNVVTSVPATGTRWEVAPKTETSTVVEDTYVPSVRIQTWPDVTGPNGVGLTTVQYSHGKIYRTATLEERQGGVEGRVPADVLNFINWAGGYQQAFVDGDTFLLVGAPGSDALGVTGTGCTAANTCTATRTLEVRGTYGQDLRLTLAPDAGTPPATTITDAATGTTVTTPKVGEQLRLTDPDTNQNGLATTYTWQVEARCKATKDATEPKVDGVPFCTSAPSTLPANMQDLTVDGAETATFHTAPVTVATGQSTTVSFPAPGKYHLRLITTDAAGKTRTANETLTVSGSKPVVSLTTTPPASTPQVLKTVKNGSTVTITGCIQGAGTAYGDDSVSITWGDGSTKQSGTVLSSKSQPITFSQGPSKSCSGSWLFSASHPYTIKAGTTPGVPVQKAIKITVTNGFSTSQVIPLYAAIGFTAPPAFTTPGSATFTAGTYGYFPIDA